MLTFFLFLNVIMNVILGLIDKSQQFASDILSQLNFTIGFFYSKTKIEGVLLKLRKRVLSMLYVCKMVTTYAGVTSSA